MRTSTKRNIKRLVSGVLVSAIAISATMSASATDASLLDFATAQVDTLFGGMELSPSQRESLIEETIEKYSSPTTTPAAAFSPSSTTATVEPDVYEIYLEKQAYIVGLINEFGGDADAESLAYNKAFLEDNYQEITETAGVNVPLVDWYIEETKYALIGQGFAASAVRPSTRAYSVTNAVDYANTYYENYNSSYPNGIHTAAPIIQRLFRLRTGGANAFKNYWQNKVSYSTFTSVGTASYSYGFRGDAISLLDASGAAYHTLIIIGYDNANQDFIVAAHFDNTHTKKLSEYYPSNGFIIYSMA